ncbi:MAG TPA: hypothetical protein VGU20_08195 [Stellaceae bacterium]|nr:hypothetical protein [Stellaceae bacterium]
MITTSVVNPRVADHADLCVLARADLYSKERRVRSFFQGLVGR